jgi:hypothetical protein
MPLYRMTQSAITPVPATNFGSAGVRERADLQRLLRENIEIIAPDTLLIAEEFGAWDVSYRRIDLLAVDRNANLVVIELKRDDTGAHMELQALRYAAMVARMTFDQAVGALHAYRVRGTSDGAVSAPGSSRDASRQALLDFLEWTEPEEASFAQDVRIVLVAADFSRELTTSVMWLNERDLDIRCVQVRPYQLDQQLLLQVEQVLPLREASEYQVKVREKARQERAGTGSNSNVDWTRYDLTVGGRTHSRLWKRRLVYTAVRHVIEHLGRSPEEIAQVVGYGRMWASVDGEHDAASFRAALVAAEAAGGRRVNPDRYLADDDELIHVNGRTYAFTVGWGTNTLPAMEVLCAKYPEAGISYEASPDQ